MAVIEEHGLGTPLQNDGAPVSGTDEVQRMTIGGTPTGGTFRLAFDGHVTAAITWSATNATLLSNIDTGLTALNNIDAVSTAEATIVAGIGTLDITFDGSNVGKKAQNLITVNDNSMTGTAPTMAIAEQTAGVDATHRNAATGGRLIDITTPNIYQNVSTTAQAPDWSLYAGAGVGAVMKSFTETVAFDDFTDGGSTVGTYTITTGSFPIGSVFSHLVNSALVGFTNDTSAVFTAGDGTDVDRYNTGTPSVFTTAATGVDLGIPSGDLYHRAVKTPVLTITTAADFTSVDAGSITVTFYYTEAP